jgi:hypothetical protein
VTQDDQVVIDSSNWPVPSAKTYAEVIGQLLELATATNDPDKRVQYGLLAGLYETLARYATQAAHQPPLPTVVPPEPHRDARPGF